MKKLALPLLLLLGACNGTAVPQPPAGVLAKDSMATLLVQMHLAEARASLSNMQGDSSHLYFVALRDSILAGHGMDTSRFNRSFRWYADNPSAADAVYQQVVDSLGVRELNLKIE